MAAARKTARTTDVGAFDGSALYDRNSDTYITAGTNGMLYTVHMNTVYETPTDESGNLKVSPTITMMKSRTKKQKDAYTAVGSTHCDVRQLCVLCGCGGRAALR